MAGWGEYFLTYRVILSSPLAAHDSATFIAIPDFLVLLTSQQRIARTLPLDIMMR
jgi:hypothetical protein